MSSTDGLVEFLTARLDEMQADAEAVLAETARYYSAADGFTVSWRWSRHTENTSGGYGVSYRNGAPTPEFVLADIAAKRRIVGLHQPSSLSRRGEPICGTCGEGDYHDCPVDWPCETLWLLAVPFSGHRDYRQEWQPS